jgi:magnesium and cobalt transporter
MNEDRPSSKSRRNWRHRLSHVLNIGLRDREHLRQLLHEAQRHNFIDADALVMIEGVLQVAEMQVRDIMVPRSQMVVVERDAPIEQILAVITASGHSRFPVVGDTRDEVVGLLLAKDLLANFVTAQGPRFNLRDALRPVVFIPESKRLNVLLKEFRASRNHMAIVVDEYGGVAGLVTIEDVLEQIVGEITDEHDTEEGEFIKKHNESVYIVKALTPIDVFNDYFGTAFSDEEFDTIGGLIMQRLGHLPKRGEVMDLDQFHIRVLRADSRRIHLLQMSLRPMDNVSPAPADVGTHSP